MLWIFVCMEINLVLSMFTDNCYKQVIYVFCLVFHHVESYLDYIICIHKNLNSLPAVEKSLIYARHNKGPRTDPCGTIILITAKLDFPLLYIL